jgi:hypothetical protein
MFKNNNLKNIKIIKTGGPFHISHLHFSNVYFYFFNNFKGIWGIKMN